LNVKRPSEPENRDERPSYQLFRGTTRIGAKAPALHPFNAGIAALLTLCIRQSSQGRYGIGFTAALSPSAARLG